MKTGNNTGLDEQVKKLKKESVANNWGVQIVDEHKFRDHTASYLIFKTYAVLFVLAFLALGGIIAWQDHHGMNVLSELRFACDNGKVEFDDLVYYDSEGYITISCSGRAISLQEHLNVR